MPIATNLFAFAIPMNWYSTFTLVNTEQYFYTMIIFLCFTIKLRFLMQFII